MDSDESEITEEFDRLSIPEDGEVITYNDEFRSPEEPIVPVAHGVDDVVVSATRRVLDAAVDLMGRDIHWLRIYTGEEARARYDDPLPEDTVRALRQFRLGLVGTPTASRETAIRLETELQRRVGLTAAVDQRSRLDWLPSPLRTGHNTEVTIVRDVTEDAAAAIEYPPESAKTEKFRDVLLSTADNPDRIPDEPTGYSVRPFSATATHSIVDAAMDFAFDRDRSTVTIVHQGDRLPASEGSFRDWARTYLEDEYEDAILDEQTFREDYNGSYPEDEIVILERRTDEICRDLLTRSDEYDVLVAPALGGRYVSAVAAAASSGLDVAPGVAIGDGHVIATPQLTAGQHYDEGDKNPIGTFLSACLLIEYIGWDDTATVVRSAISATLADGLLPRELYRRSARGTPVTVDEFADAVIQRITLEDCEPGSGGVHTTADERAEIRRIIAGLYNIVFEDHLSPDDIELNQLLDEDEEADIYLPEVGLNFYYWRRWSPERRLEVLLHELAHVEEEPGERDHGDEFYERFAELTDTAADWKPELEVLFGESIDFDKFHRFVIESVHEETIEPDIETVRQRRRTLRAQLDIDAGEHF